MSYEQKIALDQAVALMNRGVLEEAEKILLSASMMPGNLDYYIRNNLATVYLYKNDYEAAYRMMSENKYLHNKLSPFYYGRMAEICFKLDKIIEANKMLKQGIKMYEAGNKKYSEDVWNEYGYVILQGCRRLSKYKDGLKLYRNTMKYAEFNKIHQIASEMAIALNRLDQAEVYAKKSQSYEMIQVVEGFKKGLFPIFPLKFNHEELIHENNMLISMLAYLISGEEDVEKKCDLVKVIMKGTDAGVDFAENIFEHDCYEIKVKQAALDVLLELGLHKQSDVKKVIYQGKEVGLVAGRVEIREDDLISYGLLNEIEGVSSKEALSLISKSTLSSGYTSPSIMEKHIELLKEEGFNDSAQVLIKELEAYRAYYKD